MFLNLLNRIDLNKFFLCNIRLDGNWSEYLSPTVLFLGKIIFLIFVIVICMHLNLSNV